jgi:hypothetical protein
VIIVALVAHHASNLALKGQLAVAKSILVGLVYIFHLYTHPHIHEVVKSSKEYQTFMTIGRVSYFS